MSTFIEQSDYTASILPDILTRLTQGNTALLDTAEDTAIELMRGYLSARYKINDIFAATGNDRNPILVKYGVDLALKFLYDRLPPDQIPEQRVYNYEAALTWLRRVQKQEINPPDLPRVDDGTKDYVLHGSNKKRINHLT